jgi:hypothetical protein
MKKAKGEMRSEYRRSDFPRLERGKFYAEVARGTTVVLLSPENAKVPVLASSQRCAGWIACNHLSDITYNPSLNADTRKSGARRLALR